MFFGETDDAGLLPVHTNSLYVSSGIYEYKAIRELTIPAILHMDYNGYWAPLSHLYFSTSSKLIVARHPISCEEELQGFLYCSQCLTRFQNEDVSQHYDRCPTCFTCPRCTSILTVASVSSSSSSSPADGQVELKCDFCPWRSSSSGIVGKTKEDIESCIFTREHDNECQKGFDALLEAYSQADAAYLANRDSKSNTTNHDFFYYLSRAGDMSASSSKTSTTDEEGNKGIFQTDRWDVERLEAELARKTETMFDRDPTSESPLYRYFRSQDPAWEETMKAREEAILETIANTTDLDKLTSWKERESIMEMGTASVLASNLLPARVRLRSRRTLRCRRDVKEGKLSILLQPKTLPLEGDSSQKLQRGKWWLKDASAIHSIPRIILRKIPQFADILTGVANDTIETIYVEITITNPRDVAVTIELKNVESQESEEELLQRNPVVDMEEEGDHILHLHLKKSSSPVEIGCYEDELLLEDDEEAKPSVICDEEENQGWKISVKHNVAYISIPIEIKKTKREMTEKVAFLDFVMEIRNTHDGEILKVYSKMILP